MILTILVGAISVFGASWAAGRAVRDPNLMVTIATQFGMSIGGILGILRAKGKI